MPAHNFPWPNGRKKLLNNIIDELARDHPDALYAEVPVSPVSFDKGFHKITYRDFANAINGVAWWMKKALGEGKDFETLNYLGPNDLRHTILLLAAVKVGFKMLFTTPRYSVSGQVELMKKVDCKTMLLPSTRPPVVTEILQGYRMSTFEVPELEELLTQRYPLYEYSKTFEEAKHEPLVVLHTSGTTGTPKPVIWTHEWGDSFGAERYLEPPEGFECTDRYLKGSRMFSLLPPFHAGHNFISLFFSVYTGTVNIYPLAGLPPSAKMLADALEHTTMDSSMMVPPYVEQLRADPETLSRVAKHLKTIVYGGGSVSQAAGEAVTAKIDIFTGCGSTEMGFWPLIRRSGQRDQDNWPYMQFHPAMRMRLEQRSEDHYETMLERASEDTKGSGYVQPIFTIFRQLEKCKTDDLWTAHPTKPGLWQHAGRADDMLAFASGEKHHPTAVENHIATHPDVQGALIAGTQRPQAALLLEMDSAFELAEDTEEHIQTVEKIWPIIAEANEMCPVYAQVTKQHVLLIDPRKKGLPRTAKGSIRRHMAIQSYREELDRLFENAAVNSAPAPPSAHSLLISEENTRAC